MFADCGQGGKSIPKVYPWMTFYAGGYPPGHTKLAFSQDMVQTRFIKYKIVEEKILVS